MFSVTSISQITHSVRLLMLAVSVASAFSFQSVALAQDATTPVAAPAAAPAPAPALTPEQIEAQRKAANAEALKKNAAAAAQNANVAIRDSVNDLTTFFSKAGSFVADKTIETEQQIHMMGVQMGDDIETAKSSADQAYDDFLKLSAPSRLATLDFLIAKLNWYETVVRNRSEGFMATAGALAVVTTASILLRQTRPSKAATLAIMFGVAASVVTASGVLDQQATLALIGKTSQALAQARTATANQVAVESWN